MSSYLGRGLEQVDNISKLDNLTFNGGTTYALTKDSSAFTPISSNAILISVSGVIQQGNFTVSGTNIVFNTAVASSESCDFIMHYGTGVAFTPADNSITKDKTNFISNSSSSGITSKGDGGSVDGSIALNCSQNSHHTRISSSPHSAYSGNLNFVLPSSHGSSGQLMKTDGSGNLSFVDAPSAGVTKLVQAKSTSATSYLIHDNVFSTTYDFYKIIGYTNASAVDGNLRFRWRSGGSEVNGSYYRGAGYGMNLNTSGSESSTLNVARYNDSKFDLTDTTNNNNNFGDFFEITVAGMLDRDEGLVATLQASINQFRSNSNYRQYQFGGFYANQGANEDYDGFYLWYSNANIQYYSYAVYGFKK